MHKDKLYHKSHRILFKRGICITISVMLGIALPVMANSEDLFENETFEEAVASSEVTDEFLEEEAMMEEPDLTGEVLSVAGEQLDESEDSYLTEEFFDESFLQEEESENEDVEMETEDIPVDAGFVSEDLEGVPENELDFLQLSEGSEDPKENVRAGECGVIEGTVFWNLDEDGTLYLTGEGEMLDWDSPEEVPWIHCIDLIKKIDIQEGVSGIGSYAFSSCKSLTSARIG